MLTSFAIRNFRTCRDVRLDGLGPITALVGRNGVGKTNLLEAVQWVADVATRERKLSLPGLTRSQEPVAADLEMDLDGESYQYHLDLVARNDDSNGSRVLVNETLSVRSSAADWRHVFVRADNRVTVHLTGLPMKADTLIVRPEVPAMPSLVLLGDEVFPGVRHAIRAMEFLRRAQLCEIDESPHYVGRSAVPGSVLLYTAADIERNDDGSRTSITKQLVRLYIHDPDSARELSDAIGPNGLGLVGNLQLDVLSDAGWLPLALGAEPPEDGETRRLLKLTFSQPHLPDHVRVGFDSLSYGTRRAICLLLTLVTKQPSLTLLEQPEDGIHPGLLEKLMSVLTELATHSQLIFSSHSSSVMNALQPENVRLVFMDEGATTVRRLDVHELAAARDYLADSGPLADFLDLVQSES